jgi:hypothetical protein
MAWDQAESVDVLEQSKRRDRRKQKGGTGGNKKASVLKESGKGSEGV